MRTDPHPRGIAFGFHGAGITPAPSAGATGINWADGVKRSEGKNAGIEELTVRRLHGLCGIVPS